MASIEELLRYLEQFMSGHIGQPQTGSLGAAGIPGGGIPGGMPSGGAVSSGGAPGGAVPGGGAPGGAAPGGEASSSGTPPGEGPPGGLAQASPEQVQEALLQFAELHPELAPFLPGGGEPLELAAALGHLGAIPPAALEGFVPAFGGLEAPGLGGVLGESSGLLGNEPGLSIGELGGLLSEESGVSAGDLGGLLGGAGSGLVAQVGDSASAPAASSTPSFDDLDHLLGVSDTSTLDPVTSVFDPPVDETSVTTPDPGFDFGPATGDSPPPIDDNGSSFGVAEPFADVAVSNEPDPGMMTPFDAGADPSAGAGLEADAPIHGEEY